MADMRGRRQRLENTLNRNGSAVGNDKIVHPAQRIVHRSGRVTAALRPYVSLLNFLLWNQL
jgi:hypothetical protein